MMPDRHPATNALLPFFDYDHLPPHLQEVSRPIGELAHAMLDALDDGPEFTVGLRKLLEAKDCFVRSAVWQRREAEEAITDHREDKA